MTGRGVDRRIFVVGVPRSGTTLVQSLLAAHRMLTSFTESHFFSRHYRALPRLGTAILLRDPLPRVLEFLRENDVGPTSREVTEAVSRVRRALPAGVLRPLASAVVARELIAVLDVLARSRGVCGWVEKTPRHLRFVPFLERQIGGEDAPRFVHVIRGGLETVGSLVAASRQWERAYDVATCVERWNTDVEFSLQRVSSLNDHFVFYEDLTARPESEIANLLEALGLAPAPELLERYGEGAERLITAEEAWKQNVADGIRPPGSSRDSLTAAQRDQVEETLRHDLYLRLREAVS